MKRKSEQIVDRAETDYNELRKTLTHDEALAELQTYLHPITHTRLVSRLAEKTNPEKSSGSVISLRKLSLVQ